MRGEKDGGCRGVKVANEGGEVLREAKEGKGAGE